MIDNLGMYVCCPADTIGKQEAFDWGCGWVAIRAVAWSPFDEHIFATTGNVRSIFCSERSGSLPFCMTTGLRVQDMGRT